MRATIDEVRHISHKRSLLKTNIVHEIDLPLHFRELNFELAKDNK